MNSEGLSRHKVCKMWRRLLGNKGLNRLDIIIGQLVELDLHTKDSEL